MKFINELDRFRENNSIFKTIDFIENEKKKALEDNNYLRLLEILNESMGFYRDIENYNDSYLDAKKAYELLDKIEIDNLSKVITYINIANAYRGANELSESLKLYDKALNFYHDNKINDNIIIASIYNNLGLLNKIINKEEAISNFKEALVYLKDIDDDIKKGTSLVNLSETFLSLNRIEDAKESLSKASVYFNNHKDDFHYSGYLILNARILNFEKKYLESYKYYQDGLAHYDKFQGRGETYQLIYNEYKYICKLINKDSFIPMLKLSEEFFKENFKTFPKDLLNNVVIGLFGYGSECNNLDDIYSIDHDYEPGFIILYKDLSANEVNKLNEYYDSLDKFYNIYYRHDNSRHGVININDFYNSIGIINKKVNLDNLNLLTNGNIFYSGFNEFKYFREEALINYKLNCTNYMLESILKIEQAIYNYKRERIRNNLLNSKYILTNIVNKLIELYYYKENIPLIHEKERLKLIDTNSNIYKLIIDILSDKFNEEDINKELVNILLENKILSTNDYKYFKYDLSLYKNIIIEYIKEYQKKLDLSFDICNIEWEMHKSLNSINGIEECQINSPYYLIMRISQHINMSIEFLESYLADLMYAKENDISLPFIKYTFMEKNSDKELFDKAKHLLPQISEKRYNLQESIVSLQMEMVEKYLENNKEDAKYMRTIYSNTDSLNNTSYETYLRSELSSYSEKTVMLYGVNLINKSKNNENLVEEIINFSKRLYK